MDKRFLPILITILLVFAVIVSITGVVGKYLGKTAEMMLLGIVAFALLVLLLIDKNKKE